MADVKQLIEAFTAQIQQATLLGAEIDTLIRTDCAKTLTDLITNLHTQNPPSAWTNGMSQPDARGFVKLQAAEEIRQLALSSNNAGIVAWAMGRADLTGGPVLPEWYAIQDALSTFQLNNEQMFNVSANVANSRWRQAITGGNIMLGLWWAYNMTPKPGTLYDIGERYTDAAAFAGELKVGDKLYTPGVHVQDVKTALLSIMNVIGNSYLARQNSSSTPRISP